jgi:hypothetical protein
MDFIKGNCEVCNKEKTAANTPNGIWVGDSNEYWLCSIKCDNDF